MRILIATPLYPPEIGGPATDSYALVGELRRLGHEPVVLAFSRVRHLSKLVRHLWYSALVLWYGKGCDCIVAFDTVSVGLPVRIAALFTRVPYVARVPGDYAWEQGVQRSNIKDSIDVFQKKRYGVRVEMMRMVQRSVVRHAALVLAPSIYFTGIIAQWGVHPEKLRTLYLGLSVAPGAFLPPAAIGPKTMFSAGRFVPWKGFALIIDLLAAFPEWHAVLAGEGPQKEALLQYAKEKGVSERVTFAGRLTQGEILGWCARADAFVLNTYFESFSYQVLEAMIAGAAIVTTCIGSLPELIISGEEGILCKPGDTEAFLGALQSIEREPGIWNARRTAAQVKATHFSLERSSAQLAETLLTLCK